MDLSSWFRRSLLGNSKKTENPDLCEREQSRDNSKPLEEDQFLGVTQKLIDYVKSFTLETFKNFPLSDEGGRNGDDSSGYVRNDLSEWQQRHATLVLLKVKELSQLRYKLCPRCLKEHQFWRIYFSLVKSHVAEYELQAVRLAKLKEMALGNEKSTDKSAYEVEMAETKSVGHLPPPSP
ncbi:hypothetical protein UlMin_031844 [Ulmus minor]